MLRAREAGSGAVVADRLRVAETHWTRFKGLLGTTGLEPGEGLWIRPCRQVHMIGMRYPVDVAFLDDDHRVVRAIAALSPGRISPRVAAATSVLELPNGTLARVGLSEGRQVAIDGQASTPVARSGVASALCNLLLAIVYAAFVQSHLAAGFRTGRWPVILPMVALESLMLVLFLTRRRSLAVSTRPFDWVIGVTGSFLPLLLRTTDRIGRFGALGEPLQMVGLVVAVLATTTLGRSLGLVAANRGIKREGLYRFVRHPIYTGYVLADLGYIASFPSLRNLVVIVIAVTAFYVRAVVEERFLSRDPLYREYMWHVPWRFVPYLH